MKHTKKKHLTFSLPYFPWFVAQRHTGSQEEKQKKSTLRPRVKDSWIRVRFPRQPFSSQSRARKECHEPITLHSGIWAYSYSTR